MVHESDEEFDTTDMDFSDPEDYVDDISDEELLADILKTRPKETDGVDNVIIVDGCPAGIGPERCEKLKGVIRKIYQKYGKIVTEHYPVNEKGETKGELAQCGNFGNLLSHIFGKNFVKVTCLLKKLLKR